MLVPIWMKAATQRAKNTAIPSKTPSIHAKAAPKITGAVLRVNVAGRAACIQTFNPVGRADGAGAGRGAFIASPPPSKAGACLGWRQGPKGVRAQSKVRRHSRSYAARLALRRRCGGSARRRLVGAGCFGAPSKARACLGSAAPARRILAPVGADAWLGA